MCAFVSPKVPNSFRYKKLEATVSIKKLIAILYFHIGRDEVGYIEIISDVGILPIAHCTVIGNTIN